MRKIEADTLDLEAAFNSTGVLTATQNSTTNHDWKMPEDLYLDGGCLLAWDVNKGDSIQCQVVDVDNILGYGAGTVLKTWVNKWTLSTMAGHCHELETSYKGMIAKDLYLRVKYTSTSTSTDPTFAVNYKLHRII